MILPAETLGEADTIPVVIVGAGAAGLTAALAAREAGAEVLVLERDPVPQGSTALSSGLIPAAGTTFQKARGIDDSPQRFAADIQKKANGLAEARLVKRLTRESASAIDWLASRHGVPFGLVEGFLYPGHSVLRMHGTPRRTGSELMGSLTDAASGAGIDIVTSAQVDALFAAPDGRVRGVRVRRPDGSVETIGCAVLVLACSGFGGNAEMVRRNIPEMADALFFGHTGARGEGIAWGLELGAAVRHMSAYQGHGSVAAPHNILITWALMMEGGIQVNSQGRRFSNEHQGYSEQAVAVLSQPGGIAFDIFDGRLHALGLQFEDYRDACDSGAIKSAQTVESLAALLGMPADALAATIAETRALVRGERTDAFGRDFTTKPALEPPYHGVKVTGALFHTQGGLVVDDSAQVCRADGTPLPNLFAAGGAACGVSGPAVWGYLSGNGLLSAVTLGRIAGIAAASLAHSGA